MGRAETTTPDRKIKTWATVGVVISWTTWWFFLLWPVGVLAWAGILIYVLVKKGNWLRYVVLSAWLIIPAFHFVMGTVHYFTGTAQLKGVGGPSLYHGIDRDTRVPVVSSGCVVVGFEPFVFMPNNLAVHLCTQLFGYQRGSYTGTFPTEDEARHWLATADTLTVLRAGDYLELSAAGKMLRLEAEEFHHFRGDNLPSGPVIGKVINNECLLFAETKTDEQLGNYLYLADIQHQKVLCRYFRF
jgi:hypothetical protein